MKRATGAARFRAPLESNLADSSSPRLKGFLWLLVLAFGYASAQSLPADESARRTAAIDSARVGQYDDALRTLADIRVAYPDVADVLYDEIVVLGWAERDADVRTRATGLNAESVPTFVRLTVAKSLRNLRDFDGAEAWYSSALDADPENTDARLGLALSLADAGDPARARQILSPLTAMSGNPIDALLAAAYIDERDGHLLAALTTYDRILGREPGNTNALRAKALVLRQLLLPTEALAIARAHPGILTDAEIARLEADEIALEVRYGVQVAYPNDTRYVMTDRAIAALDAYLEKGVGDEPTERSLRSDRVIALAERGASREAAEAYESLARDGAEVGAPVLAAAGQAYLDLRAPETALPLLQRATALEPDNFDFNVALFFAYTESNKHDEALELARTLAASLPLVTGIAGSPSQQPNPNRLRAEVLVALALAYADRLAEAQRVLEDWLAEAPNNTDLRHELANVYRWRGWLDRSLYEYRQVLAVEPDSLQARVGKAHTELERRDYDAADAEVAALSAAFPDESAVARLASTWAAHDSSELRVDASTHDSTGVTFGSRQYDMTVTWRSAPIEHRYRAYARSHDSYAEFPEGDSRRRRLAAGAQYEFGRWFASGELSADRDGGGELGARVETAYRLDDFWSVSATLELDSDAVPLRGHRVGLDSDLVSVAARYAPDETWTVGATATLEDYSDGNNHTQIAVVGRRRLLNQPAFGVELLGEAFIGQHARDDVPYFSPLRDAVAIVGIEGQWRAVRRYDRRLTHMLRGEVGTYDQSGFARGTVWRVAYLLPIDFSPMLSTWFGIWRNRMFYDGVEEYSTTGALTVQLRF